MFKFIERKTGMKMSQILQTNRVEHRIYQVEDSSLLTSVYFYHAKEQICRALQCMFTQIGNYIKKQFKGRKGTARLGFTHEKELFNIFRSMFGTEIFG